MSHQILFLDRSPMMRRITTGILQREIDQCTVRTHARAGAGLASATHQRPDMILLDYSLPDMRVEDVIRHLGRDTAMSDVPVVLMYSNGADISALQKKYPIIRAALHKPIVPDTLVRTVSDLLGHTRALIPLPAPLPPDGLRLSLPEIPFSGDTALTPVPAIFRRLETGRETGTLRFFSGKHPVEVFLHQGSVVLCSSRDLAAYCRESPAVIPPVDKSLLDDAKRTHRQNACPFFLTLRDRDALNSAMAVNLSRDHGQRLFSRLWLQQSLMFEFEKSAALPEFAAHFPTVSSTADTWLLKTLRYLRPDSARTFLPPASIPCHTPQTVALRAQLRLTTHENLILAGCDGRRALQELAWDNGLELRMASLVAFRLQTLGLIHLWPPRQVPDCIPA